MKTFGRKNLSVNYFYFGFLFVALVLLHIYHLFVIEQGDSLIRNFFIVDALIQSFLEVALFVLLLNLIKDWLPKVVTFIFIEATFLLFVTHLVNFPLVRIMDWTIWFTLDFVSEESLENFIEMLRVSNITLAVWAWTGMFVLFLLFSALFFFWCTEKVIQKRPLHFSYRSFGKTCCALMAFLFFWDMAGVHFIPSKIDVEYYKSLPWKDTLVTPKGETIAISGPLQGLKENEFTDYRREIKPLGPLAKPDIFLFVIESLREDFISPEISPHIYQFKKENTSFELALSNANATQKSWFALFYSKYPFYWSQIQKTLSKTGSPSLAILKKMGYEIHVYSSSRFAYYKMDELLFGKNHHLADGFHDLSDDSEKNPCEIDRETMAMLCEKVKNDPQQGGRVFITFLESSHFDYSWPQESFSFRPIVDKIDYIKASISKTDLEKIKNRYRSSIHYVDDLFGSFEKVLKEKKGWDGSVIVVTSDHGEEFYEQGHIFHASHLSHVQTHVPLYYKFEKDAPLPQINCSMTCHMDIFPTLIHYLSGTDDHAELFEGESIFKEGRWPFTISTRYNASRSPYEFFIHNGTYKLTARFSNEKEIYKAKKLHLLSVKNLRDERISYTPAFLEKEFGEALRTLFAP